MSTSENPASSENHLTEDAPRATSNRSTTPSSDKFREYIAGEWANRTEEIPQPRKQAAYAADRRARLSALFPGKRLIIAAGERKQRSNDTDYLYRAHSAFAYLTGWGSDSEPGAVLILAPSSTGHEATLYFRERAGRDSDEFYANSDIGEFWIGPRPSLAQVAGDLGLATKHIDLLSIEDAEAAAGPLNDDVARDIAEMRLVKDAYEIEQMREAVASSIRGFSDIARVLPAIAGNRRGERMVEGAFSSRARLEGNGVGYETIAASGAHSCILHWTRNDGDVHPGDLILIDAGVELESYYTADLTRTLPVSGTFTPTQRQVYEAVREAADAAFAIVKPGITFRTVHETAMAVIAGKVAEWGMIPVTADESLMPENQYHRRYMVHGTSHHLGIDVHDCSAARREMYIDGVVQAGMVFTIEPGLYFQPDDLTVPEEFRGIGVRIEDDTLVTDTGAENLSHALPRTADDVETWLAPFVAATAAQKKAQAKAASLAQKKRP
jgi:Xaa-Pro aminopeptidase